MIIYVQLSGDTPAKLISYFSSPQNPEYYPGYAELTIDDSTAYSLGDYYNPADNKFYADQLFQHLSGWINPDDVYKSSLSTLRTNVNSAIDAIRGPYTDSELASLVWQGQEASAWEENNTNTPVMLNAIAAASGIQLADLAASVISNVAIWKSESGNIFGQAMAKAAALEILRQEAVAGTKTVADIQAYNCSIVAPSVVLS